MSSQCYRLAFQFGAPRLPLLLDPHARTIPICPMATPSFWLCECPAPPPLGIRHYCRQPGSAAHRRLLFPSRLFPGVSGALPSSPLQRELADGKAKHTGSLLGFPCPVVPSTPARLCSSPTVNQGPERYGPCRLPLIQFDWGTARSLASRL